MISLQLIQTVTIGLVVVLLIMVFMSLMNLRKIRQLNKEREELLFKLNDTLNKKVEAVEELLQAAKAELNILKRQRILMLPGSDRFETTQADGFIGRGMTHPLHTALANLSEFKFDNPGGKRKEVYYSHDEIAKSQFLNRHIAIPDHFCQVTNTSYWECMHRFGYTLPKEKDLCISICQEFPQWSLYPFSVLSWWQYGKKLDTDAAENGA